MLNVRALRMTCEGRKWQDQFSATATRVSTGYGPTPPGYRAGMTMTPTGPNDPETMADAPDGPGPIAPGGEPGPAVEPDPVEADGEG